MIKDKSCTSNMIQAPIAFSKTVNGFILISVLITCSILAVFLKQYYASISFIHRSTLTYLNNHTHSSNTTLFRFFLVFMFM